MSLVIFAFVLGILILIHEFGHYIIARRSGVKVEKFSIGFGPRVFSVKRKETVYTLSLLPLGGYVKLAGESAEDNPQGLPDEFVSKSPGVRARIVAAGAGFNYALGIFLFWLVFIIGYPMPANQIGGFMDGYPAKTSGLEAGDRIVSVDGRDVGNWEELVSAVQTKTSGPIDLAVIRDGQTLNFSLTPKVVEHPDLLGKKREVALLGITPSDEILYIRHNPFEAAVMACQKIYFLTVMTLKAIFFLITGQLSVRQAVTGPVGIFVITGKAAQLGLGYLLNVMAVLSTSLAIFNVLPIPVLDGGHLFFLAVERIRRRPVDRKVQYFVNQAGLILLICLMIFIFYSDIVKFSIIDRMMSFFGR